MCVCVCVCTEGRKKLTTVELIELKIRKAEKQAETNCRTHSPNACVCGKLYLPMAVFRVQYAGKVEKRQLGVHLGYENSLHGRSDF